MENISSELPKHGRAWGSLAFYHPVEKRSKITHSWVAAQRFLVCFPLRHPDATRVELQQSGGIGATGRDWGLEALHPLPLLSVGNRRQLCQHFWVTAPSRSGKRRFFGEPGCQEEKSCKRCCRSPGSAVSHAWQEAVLEGTGSSRAPTPRPVERSLSLQRSPGCTSLGLCEDGSRGAQLAGTCLLATRPASLTNSAWAWFQVVKPHPCSLVF